MAGSLTHAYFANDLYKKFDNRLKNKIILEDLKTYSEGHDVFYFYRSINYKYMKFINLSGKVFHKEKTKDFFINMISYIIDNKIENDKQVMSFLYGMISHYCLDYNIHPYITYKSGIYKINHKETKKYKSKHSELETYIDCYIIYKKEKILPEKFKMYNYFFNYSHPKINILKLIDYTYNKTYNIENLSTVYFKSLKDMQFSYKHFRYDPLKLKKNLYNLIDYTNIIKSVKIRPISYTYTLTNNIDKLNLNNNKWNHSRYKNETYTSSVLDLYDNALEDALNIIEAVNKVIYNNKNISYLNKFFLNLSYLSGKPCDDKTKNKYFEF